MKNRVLSLVLSLSIILSSGSGSFSAIAQDGTTVRNKTAAHTIAPVVKAETSVTTTATTTTTTASTTATTTTTKADTRITVSVEKEKDLPELYNGQDPDTILNHTDKDGKPRYAEYFKFKGMNGADDPEDFWKSLKLELEEVKPEDPEEKSDTVTYSLKFALKDESTEEKYILRNDSAFTVEVGKKYEPKDIKVSRVPAEDLTVGIKCETEGFLIAGSYGRFESDQVPLADLADRKYYLMNNDEDSIEYGAVSEAYTYTSTAKVEVSAKAEVIELDLKDRKAYNRDVRIKLTAYALADSVEFSLTRNGSPCINNETAYPTELRNGRFRFEKEYTFKVPADGKLDIERLKVKVTAEGAATETSVALTDGSGNTCDKLTLENGKPIMIIKDDRYEWIWFDNQKRHIALEYTDKDTEIVKVEYRYDNEENWTAIEPDKDNKSLYRLDGDSGKLDGNKIWFRAVDLAGNTKTSVRDHGSNWTFDMGDSDGEYVDPKKAIEGIELWYSKASSPTASDWVRLTGAEAELFRTYSSFNAINTRWLQLRVKTSGSAGFYINGTELTPLTDRTTDPDYKYYAYNIKNGTDTTVAINVNDSSNAVYIDALADKFDEGIEISSSRIIVENKAPLPFLTRPDFASENVSAKDKWYGIKEKNGVFVINIKDEETGIRSVVIDDDGDPLPSSETDPIVLELKDLNRNETFGSGFSEPFVLDKNDIVKEMSISIPLKNFSDGDHILRITVTDNAGNVSRGFAKVNDNDYQESDIYPVFSFSTDYTRPSGSIELVSEPVDLGGRKWYDRDEDVIFSISVDDANPYKAVWKANENSAEVQVIFSSKTVKQLLSLSDAVISDNHSYTLSAVIYDEAGNASRSSEVGRKTFYKDLSDPVIDDVTVTKSPETGFGKVLRILTFGLFSNDSVRVIVDAYDDQSDSGLDESSLEISLDGTSYEKMTLERGKYVYTITAPDNALTGKISIRATDRFGHSSSDFGFINAGEGVSWDSDVMTESNAVIIEKTAPSVSMVMPDTDGITAENGSVWYSGDPNKNISIAVSDGDSGIHRIEAFINDLRLESDSGNNSFFSAMRVMDRDVHEYTLNTGKLSEILRNTGKLPEDGHYTVKVIAEDNAGNVAEVIREYFIDRFAPEVSRIEFSVPSADGDHDVSKFVQELGYGFYFKTSLTATVNVSDRRPSSGFGRIDYILVDYSSGTKGTETSGSAAIGSDGKASFVIPADFKGQILVKAYDNVGNESEQVSPELFVVDTPKRHESERHIEISGMGDTPYTDELGSPLFNRDVNLKVRVIDTVSGIREISYDLTSDSEGQQHKTMTISNSDHQVGQSLGDGWVVKSMDQNLVTEVEKEYGFSSDNNNIRLRISLKDRSDNESVVSSSAFSIDKTSPVISVALDSPAGNGIYYRGERTATVRVIERNFDPSRINVSIQNSYGAVPSISGFTRVSDSEHTATIRFGEGDYSFNVSGSDRCDHGASVSWSGGNEQRFIVDLTDPKLTHNFDQFSNSSKNSFKSNKEMTITVTEHNFAPDLVNIRVYRTRAGQDLTFANREDCTADFVNAANWSNVGDAHTMTIPFTADYVYQVTVNGADSSGRTISETVSPAFEIDKTKPVLKEPKNRDVIVYNSKNTDASITPIVFEDSNIEKVSYTVVSYQMKTDDENVGYDMSVETKKFEAKEGTVKLGNDYFERDGIYEVKCVPYDSAGNAGEETIHTYVIQRDTDFLVYIPDSSKEKRTGLYKFDQTGIRSADFEDIEIICYITKDKEFSVEIDGVPVTGADIETTLDENRINKVNMYDVMIKNSYISQNFSGNTVDTDLTLNAVAKGGGTEQVITLGHIYIDNVKPMGEYEKTLQKMGIFDGFYGVSSRTVLIEGVSPDIDLSRCVIMANDDQLTYENGGFDYDESAHTISFSIGKGYTDIRPTLVDNAGNVNNLEMKKNVYVGNLFARWWYLFIVLGVLIIGLPILILMAVFRKRNDSF